MNDEDIPVYTIEITAFEEKVLRGDYDKMTMADFMKGDKDKPCPACGRPYKESRCSQCPNPHGCAYCHLQLHKVKRND